MANETQPARTTDDLTRKARELGRDLKSQASDFAESAADTVKTQAENLTESARELASDAGERMRTAVVDQKNAGADYVGNFAEMVRRASYAFDGEMPQAGQYIRKAAEQFNSVSGALRTRDISELVGEAQNFARQQPAAFFGAAVLAGFAAVRFFKSAPESSSFSGAGQGSSSAGRSAYSPSGQGPYSNTGQGSYPSAGNSPSTSNPGPNSQREPGGSGRGPVAGM